MNIEHGMMNIEGFLYFIIRYSLFNIRYLNPVFTVPGHTHARPRGDSG